MTLRPHGASRRSARPAGAARGHRGGAGRRWCDEEAAAAAPTPLPAAYRSRWRRAAIRGDVPPAGRGRVEAPLMFAKVLVANRGEIAIRVFRTLREMGIASVAVYSEVDRDALFVRHADEAYLLGPGPATESYLNVPRHPRGRARGGRRRRPPGLRLPGRERRLRAGARRGRRHLDRPAAGRHRRDGLQDRRARADGRRPACRSCPASPSRSPTSTRRGPIAEEIGYPVAVKAAAGGGGKGFRVALRARRRSRTPSRAPAARASASSPTAPSTSSATCPSRATSRSRSWPTPTASCVWLGERDCSVQRRHQKLVEETPSPVVSDDLRRRMGEASVRAAQAVGYTGAGTLEYLVAGEEFFFLEMNTRIQVEHTVTEAVTGLDLVREQVRVAAGEPLSIAPGGRRAPRPRLRVPHQRRGRLGAASCPPPPASPPTASRPGRACASTPACGRGRTSPRSTTRWSRS